MGNDMQGSSKIRPLQRTWSLFDVQDVSRVGGDE